MRRGVFNVLRMCIAAVSMAMAGCNSSAPHAANPPAPMSSEPAGEPDSTAAAVWATQQRYAVAAMPFELLGKVGMRRGSANIRWQQSGELFNLRLWGPFGAGTAVIDGDVAAIRFVRDGIERVGNPTEILSQELGWNVPVGALSYWVRGVPAPSAAVTSLELREGRLMHMQQSGWTIDIDAYKQQADGGWLPARLTAREVPSPAAAPDDGARFTLVVQSWVHGAALATASTAAGAAIDAPAPSSAVP